MPLQLPPAGLFGALAHFLLGAFHPLSSGVQRVQRCSAVFSGILAVVFSRLQRAHQAVSAVYPVFAPAPWRVGEWPRRGKSGHAAGEKLGETWGQLRGLSRRGVLCSPLFCTSPNHSCPTDHREPLTCEPHQPRCSPPGRTAQPLRLQSLHSLCFFRRVFLYCLGSLALPRQLGRYLWKYLCCLALFTSVQVPHVTRFDSAVDCGGRDTTPL